MRKTNRKISILLIALVLLFTSGCAQEKPQPQKPEQPDEEVIMTDTDWEEGLEEGEELIVDEDTPLAGEPKTEVETYTEKTSTKTKMSKKAKKTYSTKNVVTHTSGGTYVSGSEQVTYSTKVVVTTTKKYKKGSRYKTTVKNTVTTVTTTTVTITAGPVSIREAAPKAHGAVLQMFEDKQYTCIVDPTTSFTGEFNTRTKTITIKNTMGVVYHELGHFVAYYGGRLDRTIEFADIYEEEKELYTASNKAYVCSSPAEYFAESYKDYVENATSLRNKRPRTFEYMERVVGNLITTAMVK
ncbi:MAG: hypothetical protein HUJ58_03480 [Erysipelotrichaceae bacterium]|nr:hypothetical protein [Erysipelotrichaceae bacterium]